MNFVYLDKVVDCSSTNLLVRLYLQDNMRNHTCIQLSIDELNPCRGPSLRVRLDYLLYLLMILRLR